ncbi:hypothetical protein A2W24_02700 [Microgenomates group bacterium RBG_16_45_19]|nr:MAG: hypothetical protein A2W24_02700 [Microgenomates group bacterium RBG_16_45_19]
MTEDQNKQPFYDQDGQIANQDTAQEVANIENLGQTPARAREAELKRQHETNLTKDEEFYLEIMAGLVKKYPLAFTERFDSQGRSYLILNNGSGKLRDTLIISQEGAIVTSSRPHWIRDYDLTPILSCKTNFDTTIKPIAGLKDANLLRDVKGGVFDLKDESTHSGLKQALEEEQGYQESHPQTGVAIPTAKSILERL